MSDTSTAVQPMTARYTARRLKPIIQGNLAQVVNLVSEALLVRVSDPAVVADMSSRELLSILRAAGDYGTGKVQSMDLEAAASAVRKAYALMPQQQAPGADLSSYIFQALNGAQEEKQAAKTNGATNGNGALPELPPLPVEGDEDTDQETLDALADLENLLQNGGHDGEA